MDMVNEYQIYKGEMRNLTENTFVNKYSKIK